MGLGKQERRGIVILVFVTLAITSLGFVMRYCGRPGDAASQVVPVQTVIYRPAADDAAEDENYERWSRHKKKSARKKAARKKAGKGIESKAGASQGPRRDFLRDTIPGPRDYR
jgi:hypothetical protein